MHQKFKNLIHAIQAFQQMNYSFANFNFTAWYAEVFAAQISFFLPASELNHWIKRMSNSLQTLHFQARTHLSNFNFFSIKN